MTDMTFLPNTVGKKWLAVNSAVTNVVSNTTAETAFDQTFPFPSQIQHVHVPPMLVRIKGFGIISTGAVNLGCTVRVRFGGIGGSVIATTGSFSLTSLLSDQGFSIESEFVVTSSGQIESQGVAVFSSGLLTVAMNQMANAAPISFDPTISNDVVVTCQWVTATTSNKMQFRTLHAELDGP